MYENFHKERETFDFSDYNENSNFYDKTTKKVIDKIKVDTRGVPIVEFIGLKSKICLFIKDDNKGDKIAKVINKNVIKS